MHGEKFRRGGWIFSLLLGFWALTIGSATGAQLVLHVFAAASLTDALSEIAGGFEAETGAKVLFNFAGSSTLARQIQEGAPADVFFSADEEKLDRLEKNGLIESKTRRTLLSNSLVVVVSNDSETKIESGADLRKVRRLALAEPQTVPAGIYARRYLEKEGLWAALSGRIIPTENVRAALAAVESGNVDAGIVYKTDAAISSRVRVAWQIPMRETPGIAYPVAVVKEAKNPALAQKFVEQLGSAQATQIFERFGFTLAR